MDGLKQHVIRIKDWHAAIIMSDSINIHSEECWPKYASLGYACEDGRAFRCCTLYIAHWVRFCLNDELHERMEHGGPSVLCNSTGKGVVGAQKPETDPAA